jgi:DNA-directed RNA polymerase specialized sigma24 family protein
MQPAGREVAFEHEPSFEDDALSALEAAERREAFWTALERLPDRHRELMTALLAEPPLSYAEASRRTGIPVGSIGPIRARSLDRLRRDETLRGFQ